MIEYRQALPQDEAHILDFINMVFSMDSQPHDFAALLPKVYAHAGFSRYHYVAVQEERILGVVALLPMTLRIEQGSALRIGYIGSVSVHPYARGAGHMKALMAFAVNDAKAQKLDMLLLGGRRQRYGYFGFEKGGTSLLFSLNADNIRHALCGVSTDMLSIREVTHADDATLQAILPLCSRQPFCCERAPERLLDIFHSWHNRLYVFERTDGNAFAGYLCASGDRICELALTDERLLPETLAVWMKGRSRAEILVPICHRVRASYLKSIAEGYTLSDAHMLRVLNWQHVLEKLLRFKAGYQPLCDGSFIFEIEDAGCYQIAVCNHEVSVSQSDCAPQIVFTPQRAVEFFFSPYTALFEASPMLKSLLPLPVFIPAADRF